MDEGAEEKRINMRTINISVNETIFGKSASDSTPFISSKEYVIKTDSEGVKVTYEQLKELNDIIPALIERDKPPVENVGI